jgi:hypothetical protein
MSMPVRAVAPLLAGARRRAGTGSAELFGLASCYLLMLASVSVSASLLFVAAAALSYVLDARFMRLNRYVATRLGRNQMGVTVRFQLRQLLLVVFVLHAATVPSHTVTLLVLGLVSVHLCRSGYARLVQQARDRLARPLQWRNLDVPGHPADPPPFVPPIPPVFGVDGARLILHFDAFIVLGGVIAVGLGTVSVLPTLVALTVVSALTVLAAAVRRQRQADSAPSAEVLGESVLAAIHDLQPEVMVYFSNPHSATYALNVWLPIIDRVSRRTLIVIREPGHLRHLSATTTPLVVVRRTVDLERLPLATVRAAIYSTNVIKNNDMLRVPGVRHVFVNHGDSDKVSSFNPVARVFDEIWVAGEAGRDRYLAVGEGFRPEQIHVVGRPQLAEIATATTSLREDASSRLTVLYAPTWEGFFDDADYSSLASMGRRIVEFLLAAHPPVRLLFKPHPTTGTRNASAAAARLGVEELLRNAGGDHKIVESGPDSLYAAFNEADVLISDVSSVITDFLASRKPYIVTNPRRWDPAEFQAVYPATSGGHLLVPDCARLREFLADIVGEDRLRARRHALATHLVGSADQDQVQRFLTAIDGVIARNTYRPARVDHAGAPVLVAEQGDSGSEGLSPDDILAAAGEDTDIDEVSPVSLGAVRTDGGVPRHHGRRAWLSDRDEIDDELSVDRVAWGNEGQDGDEMVDASADGREELEDVGETQALQEAEGLSDVPGPSRDRQA